MNISEIQTALPGVESPGISAKQELGRDDFLNLLVVQLKNQDPMDPMESAEFSAQLAQFSALEQLTHVNEGIQLLVDQQTSTNNAQAVSYIGKAVKATGNAIQLTEDKPAECVFELEGDAAETMLYISDPFGNVVKTMELGSLNQDEYAVKWNGMTDQDTFAGQGLYSFEIVAMNAAGEKVPSTPFISAETTGISLSGGIAVLMADELEIPLTSVIEIGQPDDDQSPKT